MGHPGWWDRPAPHWAAKAWPRQEHALPSFNLSSRQSNSRLDFQTDLNVLGLSQCGERCGAPGLCSVHALPSSSPESLLPAGSLSPSQRRRVGLSGSSSLPVGESFFCYFSALLTQLLVPLPGHILSAACPRKCSVCQEGFEWLQFP